MTEHTPAIDFENLPAPSEGFLVTHFITVRSVARLRQCDPRAHRRPRLARVPLVVGRQFKPRAWR